MTPHRQAPTFAAGHCNLTLVLNLDLTLVIALDLSARDLTTPAISGCARGVVVVDPTTRQVELFLKAKRPKSALAIAVLRGFPWWRLSLLGSAGVAALNHFMPLG